MCGHQACTQQPGQPGSTVPRPTPLAETPLALPHGPACCPHHALGFFLRVQSPKLPATSSVCLLGSAVSTQWLHSLALGPEVDAPLAAADPTLPGGRWLKPTREHLAEGAGAAMGGRRRNPGARQVLSVHPTHTHTHTQPGEWQGSPSGAQGSENSTQSHPRGADTCRAPQPPGQKPSPPLPSPTRRGRRGPMGRRKPFSGCLWKPLTARHQ